MAKHSGQPARNLFPGHNVNGKGSKTRTNLASKQWLDNYDEIDWSGSVTGFFRSGGKLVRRYGNRPAYDVNGLETSGLTWRANISKRIP